ncbi:hypothetical protein SASPL_120786 [Salvia splendens]|uniref:hAT-like transposase RNase-H fold domain-containing protein n=1 Tax=Salvia splendens TaxID=180675 RepID=A0A8X8XTN5_SALSN|nr:hypothetical protein SASPL_120786 [Salvia splendens]
MSESLVQAIASNQPELNVEMLEDIEIEKLGEGNAATTKEKENEKSKKRKTGAPAERIALCKYIILDELPFKAAEKEGFKIFVAEICPMFQISSGYTSGGCKREFSVSPRLTDIVGKSIGELLVDVVTQWLLPRLFSCTLDNAAANDVAMRHVHSKLNARNILATNGQYLHQRCVSHIINLVVEGLEDIGMSVIRGREAVKWINASPSRSRSFKDIAKIAKVDTSKFLCMDVPTRWNLTYLMLEAALPYEPAMRLFQTMNPYFASDLKERNHRKMSIGVPTELDWIEVKRMCGFLEQFYNLTHLVFGSHYFTSHQVLMELCDMIGLITDLEEDEDDGFRNMVMRLRLKLGKYWLEETKLNPKMNKILYIAIMLDPDPRQKMKHVEYCLKLVYGSTWANELLE